MTAHAPPKAQHVILLSDRKSFITAHHSFRFTCERECAVSEMTRGCCKRFKESGNLGKNKSAGKPRSSNAYGYRVNMVQRFCAWVFD